MSRESKRFYQYRFIEVGLLVNGFEFYHEFCVPINLAMRRFNDKSKSFDHISIEDWLSLDFPIILRRKLFGLNSGVSIETISVKTISPTERPLSPIVSGNSLPQTWCDTFVYLIASYFVNNYKHGK